MLNKLFVFLKNFLTEIKEFLLFKNWTWATRICAGIISLYPLFIIWQEGIGIIPIFNPTSDYKYTSLIMIAMVMVFSAPFLFFYNVLTKYLVRHWLVQLLLAPFMIVAAALTLIFYIYSAQRADNLPEGEWQVALHNTEDKPCPASFQGDKIEWKFVTRRSRPHEWNVVLEDGRTFQGYYDNMNGLWASDEKGDAISMGGDGKGDFSFIYLSPGSQKQQQGCLTRYVGTAILQ